MTSENRTRQVALNDGPTSAIFAWHALGYRRRSVRPVDVNIDVISAVAEASAAQRISFGMNANRAMQRDDRVLDTITLLSVPSAAGADIFVFGHSHVVSLPFALVGRLKSGYVSRAK